MKDEDALATILLVSRLRSEGLDPLEASEYWKLCDQIDQPSALLGQDEERLRRDHTLAPDVAARVVALLDRATAIAFALERLDQSGIATLTPFDEHYPARFVARLGDEAPPVIHAAGRLGLLDRAGLGVVGSRDVGQEGADVADAAARAAVRCGIPVVSGGARGVDQLAMNAAVDAGGTVIGILSDALIATLRRSDIRRAIHDGQVVVCTPYGPEAPSSTGNAMGRDKLIYAQSLLTLVVASDVERGDTWAGATEALRHGFGRVAVWRGSGEGPGNEVLERRGAEGIGTLDRLHELLAEPEPEPVPARADARQPALFPTPEAAMAPRAAPSARNEGDRS